MSPNMSFDGFYGLQDGGETTDLSESVFPLSTNEAYGHTRGHTPTHAHG